MPAQNLYVLVLSAGTFISTMLGGLFALRLRDRLHLILGFSAGALVGVAFFDLLPEALNLVAPASGSRVAAVVAAGFIGYMVLDRTIAPHGDKGPRTAGLWQPGALAACCLSIHSFLDGFAIGLAFKVSSAVGAIVAAAVLTHDFSDGINTVSIILRNRGGRRRALAWLLVDAMAPVLGAASTLLLSSQPHFLGPGLALFAGSFLYIGASDLLPESYHAHPTRWTTLSTIIGLLTVYAAVRLATL